MGNVSNAAHIDGNPHAISTAEMMKIIDQMNRSICKINYLNSNGTGFFCKKLISEENQNENYFLGLLTCNHVLDEDIKGKKDVSIYKDKSSFRKDAYKQFEVNMFYSPWNKLYKLDYIKKK